MTDLAPRVYVDPWMATCDAAARKNAEAISARGRVASSPPLAPTPCCERDHDGDGNCDRHPAKPPPSPLPTLQPTPADLACMLRLLGSSDVTPYVRAVLVREWGRLSEEAGK